MLGFPQELASLEQLRQEIQQLQGRKVQLEDQSAAELAALEELRIEREERLAELHKLETNAQHAHNKYVSALVIARASKQTAQN